MTLSISRALLLAMGLATSALSTVVKLPEANSPLDTADRDCEWFLKFNVLDYP